MKGQQTHDRVSFDVNPTSREILAQLAAVGALSDLVALGARIHQAGCMGLHRDGAGAGVGRE
ncbi:MAG TPA: hypothetical protein VFY45_07900 [Baekduia sp.]|nr:hypothetical protein [Baekduia sp.]